MSAYDPATLPADSPQPRQEQYNGNFGETYTLPIRAYSCPRDTGRLASCRPQGTSASPSPCALSHQQHRQMPLPVYAFWRQAIHSAPNLATHSGHLHSIFYLSAMLPTFDSDFAQSLGPTAGGEDPAITIFAVSLWMGMIQVAGYDASPRYSKHGRSQSRFKTRRSSL